MKACIPFLSVENGLRGANKMLFSSLSQMELIHFSLKGRGEGGVFIFE